MGVIGANSVLSGCSLLSMTRCIPAYSMRNTVLRTFMCKSLVGFHKSMEKIDVK